MGRLQEDFDTDEIIRGNPATATESSHDEIEIMVDQDETQGMNRRGVRNKAANLLDVENEPMEFIRGEVDVKTQMDRTTRDMELQIQGVRDNSQPGLQTHGIEEAAAATDRDLAKHSADRARKNGSKH